MPKDTTGKGHKKNSSLAIESDQENRDSKLTHLQPTDEQSAILEFASKLKKKRKSKGELVRIIAGAGTGKTTTLKLLSEQLVNMQKFKILYLVFNKQAQADANIRFKGLAGTIDCKTMHGAALQALQKLSTSGPAISICTDAELKRKIEDLFNDEITRWLRENGVYAANSGKKEMEAFSFKVQLSSFYIFKTLENFYRSSEPLESLADSDKMTYFVAKTKHQEKIGFENPGDFYCSAATKVWNLMSSLQIPMCHDVYLKIVQLRGVVFGNYNCLLVDESQDLTPCQIDLFVHKQIDHHKHVFLVGDACQTIYSFRGARSKFIAQLENTIDFKLTQSFRFGSHISFVANTFLWIKEKSPQLPMFVPYRLVGKNKYPGLVHGYSDEQRPAYPYTIVARQNATLITKSLLLLQNDPAIRICLNGGNQGFSSIIEQTLDLYRLYAGQKPQSPKFSLFDSYEAFKISVTELEQSQDLILISLVESLGDELPSELLKFKESVLKRAVSSSDYDVLLSTTHQAKGLEWDRVEVENDFLELDIQKKPIQQPPSIIGYETAPPNPKKVEYEFALPSYGDDLNLWYVAVTRARQELVLPSRYWDLVELMSKVKNNNPIMAKIDNEDANEKLRFNKEELRGVKFLFSTFKNVIL